MRISDWSSDVCSSDLRFGADPRQFRNVIVKSGTDGRLVRLEDVARVELGGKDYNSRSYLDGQTAVAMGVFQRPGTTALETSEQVMAKMKELSKDLDRKSVVKGKSVAVRVDLGGRRRIQKKK